MKFIQQLLATLKMIFGFIKRLVVGEPADLSPDYPPYVQERLQKIKELKELRKDYVYHFGYAQGTYAQLVERLGMDHEVSVQWAASIHNHTDLIEDMGRQTRDAIRALEDEIEAFLNHQPAKTI